MSCVPPEANVALPGAESWRRWRRVEDFPRDRPLFVSFSNAHYSDLMLNWVKALRILDVRADDPRV